MVYGGGSKPSDLYDLVGSNPTAPTDSVLPKDTASSTCLGPRDEVQTCRGSIPRSQWEG